MGFRFSTMVCHIPAKQPTENCLRSWQLSLGFRRAGRCQCVLILLVLSLASLCSDQGAVLTCGHQLILPPKERTEQGAG